MIGKARAADDLLSVYQRFFGLRATPRTMRRVVSLRRDYQDGGLIMKKLGISGLSVGPQY
jgi:hypothetical protein